MKDMNFFNTLVARARVDEPPHVDVAAGVLSTLAAEDQRLEWLWNRPLMWVAAISSATAVPFATVAVLLHHLWAGPLDEISQAISWVM